ncbi:uncharacterized protein LOC115919900 [Strongylocentrotus purpuratus]|uniref:Retrovirus-related Pol polyprotein from transposon 412 n=1 Tax=Strongylocentrotus purpuratus TaxID=7668 RepID=A0A7M7N4D6_STRPU|nr:uncharacterized protein LOC115919900 [Strongylocentrotus purpuratus]
MNIDSSVEEIVEKIDGFYGTVESGAVLLQQLYSSRQGTEESVTAYSARLQLAIDKVELRKGISPMAKDETLRVVFWKGMSNEVLKQAIRHKYDLVRSFDELIRVARQAEQEHEDFEKFHRQVQSKSDGRIGVVKNASKKAVRIPANHAMVIEGPIQTSQQHVDTCDANRTGGLSIEGLDFSESPASSEDVDKVRNILRNYPRAFSQSDTDLGHSNIVTHNIPLTDQQPFRERYRRIPPAMYAEVREHVRSMHEAGVIRESFSPYASPVVLVRKKDGSLRFCIDFRKLNQRTVRDSYALPRIDETLQMMQGARWFSSLDLKSGYWQLEIDERDKQKTAFVLPPPLGLWECNRMPFGLCNAPSTFQRAMEKCLGELNHTVCVVYLDDIIIYSKTMEEHVVRLEAVIQRLSDHGFKLKASKCKLLQTRVKYLGHILTSEGIGTDPDKTESVRSWPTPKNVKELRSFLGLASYYRKFIPNLSKIMSPMLDLLDDPKKRKGKVNRSPSHSPPWIWTRRHDEAFLEVKNKLISAPVLQYVDFSKPFLLHTDASTTGLGAALYQLDEEGRERVIAYASRTLNKSERNCTAHKLEFLALKWAVTEKFHDFLYGNKTHVRTDNNPLTYVLTTAKLDATGHRWLAALANYDLTLTYRSGKMNIDADALSRRPSNVPPSDTPPDTTCSKETFEAVVDYALNVDVENSPFVENVGQHSVTVVGDVGLEDRASDNLFTSGPPDWTKEQGMDPVISRVIDYVKQDVCPLINRRREESKDVQIVLREWDKLVLKNGVLYRRRIVEGIHKSRTTPYHPQGNGSCERMNRTLLSMLGTLTEDKKSDWKSYVAPLVHAYNCTKHSVTGFSPFYLMYGRHPRLPIDMYLGLDARDDNDNSSAPEYVTRLRDRLDYAYKITSERNGQVGAKNKGRYDQKLKENKIQVGDRVLVKIKGVKGKNKLGDIWGKDPHIVVEQPNVDIPVFKVTSKRPPLLKRRTVHRDSQKDVLVNLIG